MAGGVAQGVDPEFKPQYCRGKKKYKKKVKSGKESYMCKCHLIKKKNQYF
jgi:hypothetical protein